MITFEVTYTPKKVARKRVPKIRPHFENEKITSQIVRLRKGCDQSLCIVRVPYFSYLAFVVLRDPVTILVTDLTKFNITGYTIQG